MAFLNIIWPAFAMVGWIFVVWFWLLVVRMRHLKRVPPTRETFATSGSAMQYFEPVELPANNLRNLLEIPMLFFALVPLLLITRQADHLQMLLAWLFVLLRVVHSWVHIVVRNVRVRALVYWLSTAVLMAMWIGFFVDMVAAAHEYNQAMGAMAVAQP